MIQPAACLSLSALALPADAAGPAAGEGAEGTDFGALLALQGLATAPGGEAAMPPAALPDAAAAATAPASPGKTLPPVLPVESGDAPVESAETVPLLAVPVKTGGPAVPVPAKNAKERAQARSTDKTAANEEPFESADAPTAAPNLPIPASGTTVLPAQTAPVAIAPEQAAPRDRSASSEPSTAATSNPIPPEPTRLLVPAQTARAFRAQAEVQVQELPVTSPSPQAAAIPAIAALTRPAEEVRIALALPRTLVAPQVAGELKAALPDSPTEPAAALSLPSTTAPTAPLPAIQAAPQIRPHDFAALIDRLSAARDAVQPQSVSITVAHQDFGPVRLHFQPEEAGLTVAMSCADPDFARAAAAAPAAIQPTTASAEASFGQNRGDGAAGQATTQHGGSQSRGASTSQREGHGQPQANPTPRGQQQRPAPRPGIFA